MGGPGEATVVIAEAGYQRGRPQDRVTRNCWCNGTTLCQGLAAEFAARGLGVLLLSADRRIGNLSGKMMQASLEDKGLNAPFPSRELFPLGAPPKERA